MRVLRHDRRGITLIEVILVLGIMGVLMGLLIVAVQKAREAASRTQSMNNLRQLALATQNFADAHDNRLPSLAGNAFSANPGQSPFFAILPYIDEENLYRQHLDHPTWAWVKVRLFLSPADPTTDTFRYVGVSSYAANAQVFDGYPSMPRTFGDGTSNTILFAEHYAMGCHGAKFEFPPTSPNGGVHRATFADGGRVGHGVHCGDIYPMTDARISPPFSIGSPQGGTFQIAPHPLFKMCDPHLAQTPHYSGMLVALGDNSVRTLAKSTSEQIFGEQSPRRVEKYWMIGKRLY